MCSDTSIHLFTPDQLYTIITALSQRAIYQESNHSKRKLENLHKQLETSLNFAHAELFNFVTAVLYFLEKNYSYVKFSIRHCSFQPDKHQFLRDVYRRAHEMAKGKLVYDFVCYPKTIDPVDSDGIPKTTSNFLKDYYDSRRVQKKALNIDQLAEDTEIPLDWIKMKFKTFRRGLKATAQKEVVEAEPFTMKFEPYQNSLPAIQFSGLPSPPMTYYDMFPTTRIPLDQPLTILIPN